MEQYIGSKIVQAEPAWLVLEKEGEAGEIVVQDHDLELTTAKTVLNGYKVVYEDGYESWSPKEVFEAAYRRTDGMSFGLAIEAAKKGMRIARKGWNGKNQYVELGTDFQYTCAASDIPGSVGVQHTDIGSKALVFVGTRGSQVGWLASQADMLADDWHIVEG
jgi:hypothetical protein